jgi:hypothetical protein
MSNHNMFIFAGNCRTFVDCIASCYDHVMSKLFQEADSQIHVYFYLKLTDPGPKNQRGWDFAYQDVNRDKLISTLEVFKSVHPELSVEYKILESNEISDADLFSQVGDRSKYVEFYSEDSKLLRGMNCHYNLEQCGNYILDQEKRLSLCFNSLVYIRPDLCFFEDCQSISAYHTDKVTLGRGPNVHNNDHIAIVPRAHLDSFFFGRMNVYRTNTTHYFTDPESVYWHTITFEVKAIGKYFIKRNDLSGPPKVFVYANRQPLRNRPFRK